MSSIPFNTMASVMSTIHVQREASDGISRAVEETARQERLQEERNRKHAEMVEDAQTGGALRQVKDHEEEKASGGSYESFQSSLEKKQEELAHPSESADTVELSGQSAVPASTYQLLGPITLSQAPVDLPRSVKKSLPRQLQPPKSQLDISV